MPQTEVKLEFFAFFTAKDLFILGLARIPYLWVTLCIDLFRRINSD